MYICCYCEAWGSGGIESFWISLAGHIDRSLYKIDIVAAEKLSGFYDSRLEELEISLKILSGSTKNYISNYRLLKKLFQSRHYDVVHMNAYHAVTLAYALCAKKCGIGKVVLHSHSCGIKKGRGHLVKYAVHTLARFFFADIPAVRIACSKQAQRFLYPAWQEVQIIPNGVDADCFRYSEIQRERVRQQLKIEHAFVAGMVGRLCKEKNQAFGIRVFAELKKRCPNAVLLIVGEGETENALRRQVRRSGLADCVIFYGASRHVSKLMQGMDVLLMPSVVEGYGITAVEAQACGLPVVCSDCLPGESIADEKLIIRMSLKKSRREWAEALERAVSRQEQEESAGVVRQQERSGSIGRQNWQLADTDYDIHSTAEAVIKIWNCRMK